MKRYKTLSFSLAVLMLLCLALLTPANQGLAQGEEPAGPVYIVQEGDSLWSIALRFRVSVDDLVAINNMSNPNQLVLGDRLVIPGLTGVQGVLVSTTVAYGDTLRSLSRRYGIAEEMLIRLNHLTSPAELYVGAPLVLVEQETTPKAEMRSLLSSEQSLLELAVAQGGNPWSYVISNNLQGTWDAIPGDVLRQSIESETGTVTYGPSSLPGAITAIELQPSPYVQGKAAVIRVTAKPGMTLSGSLNERQLEFFPDENGDYISMMGVHAMTKPGLYPLVLSGNLPETAPDNSAAFSFSQAVYIRSGNYPFDPVLIVSPETIDPAVTAPEDAQWTALASTVTPEKLWQGAFQNPMPEPFQECWPSRFGNRRSYNGSAYVYFHSGLDFCGGVGIEIYAPANGIVVFAGPLTVRGNATMIDHGWGVYSAYMHQSEIKVQVGDRVEPGQVIGLVGGTGRVTGPHLHWEIWSGGVQVDPLDWLQQTFP
ncbi:MAG: LysM peptidoglycan-binding domain-containing M23 family metallopeptidase [Chloroflexota bacterium]